ncbi:MAG: ice-binding family protein [Armatimonadia bacterium]
MAGNRDISATFSEAMASTSITTSTFTLKQGTTPVLGAVIYYAGQNATFLPKVRLAPNTTFTAMINRNATDVAGNHLPSNKVWQFTTGGSIDTTAPTVISTFPANAAKISSLKKITATFSEPMMSRTVTTEEFTVKLGASRITGTVTYADRTMTFTPLHPLPACRDFTALITTDLRDEAGTRLAQPFSWHFSTGLAPVFLGSAQSFAVLAYSTVTNTALRTTVNGDVGVSPGTAVTGFPPGAVNGVIHAGDSVAARAKLALTTAYNDAAGRTCHPVAVAGNLGGQTLYPGLYKSTSSLAISSGDLTLDARGDANAVFIFEMASTFTMTSGRQIILSGGAKAGNVYWQVGSSATLGSTSVFKGNILAYTSITLNTGATVDGRLLASNGAVTLDGNTINRP